MDVILAKCRLGMAQSNIRWNAGSGGEIVARFIVLANVQSQGGTGDARFGCAVVVNN